MNSSSPTAREARVRARLATMPRRWRQLPEAAWARLIAAVNESAEFFDAAEASGDGDFRRWAAEAGPRIAFARNGAHAYLDLGPIVVRIHTAGWAPFSNGRTLSPIRRRRLEARQVRRVVWRPA